MKLPTEDSERQKILPWTYFHEYFPHAQVAKAKHSYDSNIKHAGSAGMKWAKEKSVGSFDRVMRHMIDFQHAYDSGDMEAAKKELTSVAWRADELLERFLTNLDPFDNEAIMQELSDIGQAIEAEKPTEYDEVLHGADEPYFRDSDFFCWANENEWYCITEDWWENDITKYTTRDSNLRKMYSTYLAERNSANDRPEANQ